MPTKEAIVPLGLWFLIIEIIQIKYLNNMIEQDHRPVKKKMKAALGLILRFVAVEVNYNKSLATLFQMVK
ncbi:hypothetical protein ACR9PT_11445 [Piscirickettsia salmonis]|uniref:hypothetical protein n=1 Tax=Piscirickettsia salmonis TaxID=1238 RepID=UPI003EBAA96D